MNFTGRAEIEATLKQPCFPPATVAIEYRSAAWQAWSQHKDRQLSCWRALDSAAMPTPGVET